MNDTVIAEVDIAILGLSGSGGERIVVDVASGAEIGRVMLASADDVAAAGRAAREAQPQWAARGFRERAEILARAAAALERLAPDHERISQQETGATLAKVRREVGKTADQFRLAIGLLEHPTGFLLPDDTPGRLSFTRRVPMGVVGVIAPWNAPLMLAMRSVIPALALGNAVLVKPDIKTPLTGGTLIARIFADAGLPEGVLTVLPGGPEIGQAVVASPHTDLISFTGSSAAGRQVGAVAGGMLKKVILELGGNNAFVVLPGADLEAAVRQSVRGSYSHQGQICMATGRHLVHESIADAYVDRLVTHARAQRLGDPRDPDTTLGPLIDTRQAERVQDIVDRSVAAGARVLTGGRHHGQFYEPTVLVDVMPGNPAFDAEIFGPVLPVTTFASDDEAVQIVNSSSYGLAAAIHSADLTRALAMAARIRAGMIHINGQTVTDYAWAPMGGMGSSGNGGRFGGHWSLEEFTTTQWVTASAPTFSG